MIVAAHTLADKLTAKLFMREHGVDIPMSEDFNALGRFSGNKLIGAVVYNGMNGKICSMHCAGDGNWISREFLREAFRYPFETLGMNYLIGTVAGNNSRALKLDRHLGFTVLFRLANGWDQGVDMVIMGMTKQSCRYLKAQERQNELQAA